MLLPLACTLKSPTTPVTLLRFQICSSRRRLGGSAEVAAGQDRQLMAPPGQSSTRQQRGTRPRHHTTQHLEHCLLVAADVAEEAVGSGPPQQAAAQHRAVGQHQAAKQGEVVLAHSVRHIHQAACRWGKEGQGSGSRQEDRVAALHTSSAKQLVWALHKAITASL